MRILTVVCLALAAGLPLYPQAAGAKAAQTARSEVERIRGLVEAGALPRKALADAERALEESRDGEILAATLYASLGLEEMTEEQSREMIAAATRQMNRRREKLDEARGRVDAGVAPLTSLTPLLEEFDSARKVHDQAVGRARLFEQLAAMVRAEQEMEARMDEASPEFPRYGDRFDGDSALGIGQLRAIETAFEREFGRALPVSARGETVLHRTLGYDHRGRVDVAVYPDSREGLWLRHLLEAMRVPYLAFRGSVPGQSTGAHIHVGPPSNRIRRAD